MLGRLSPHALAAGSLGFFLYQPLFLFGLGVVGALSPIAAAKIGAGHSKDELRRATHQALISAVFFSVVVWVALIGAVPFLLAIGEPGDVARDAGVYLRGFQWGLAPSLLYYAARAAFSALERPRPALIAGLLAVAFNALANYALIFGKLGMPALGIIGSGFATTLSQTLMCAILLATSLIDPRMRPLRLFALPWRLAGTELAALWRLGLPIGAMIVAEVGVFASATLAMGLFSTTAIEAHTIALQIASLAFMVPLGLGQAATVRVGLAYGAGDARAISRSGWSAFGLTALFAVFSAAAMIGAPRLLIAPFIDVDAPANAATIALAVALLRDRRPLPDRRRKPGGARQHVARAARFARAPHHCASRLLGDRRAGRRGLGICDAAWSGRHMDRACGRARRRRRSSVVALGRQGAPGFCGLTLGSRAALSSARVRNNWRRPSIATFQISDFREHQRYGSIIADQSLERLVEKCGPPGLGRRAPHDRNGGRPSAADGRRGS